MYGVARARQKGVVVVILVVLLLLGGFMFALGTVKVAAVGVERERSSLDVLAQAKGALIDFAVSDNTRPGQLPCPDVNDDGEATSPADFIAATGACVSLIGRLPWKTLGLPDLRDDSGERLWYAVSNDFRANNTGVALVPLNSDTAFRAGNTSLTISGLTPGSNLAAIVIAPGAVLTRTDGWAQQRACAAGCDPRHFLDIAAGEDNADGNTLYVFAARSATFNDRLMPVYSDDIMRLVERRAARELAQHLRDHYDAWNALAGTPGYTAFKGFYPWAAPLNDPSVVAPGVATTTSGQLPLDASSVNWQSANATLGGCAGVNTAQISCTAISFLGVLTINGRVRNVGTAFVDPPTNLNVNVAGLVLGPTTTWTLVPGAQALDFQWSATLLGLATVTVQAPTASTWTTSSWLATNNWQQNAFYALSAGYALNGADACGGAAPPCITIANTAAPNNDKQAIVLMSGRALPAAAQMARPVAPVPVALNQFFEGANNSGTLAFENNMRNAAFNDTAVAVRP